MIISKEESAALNSLRFLCIITLVFHHTQVDHLVINAELSVLLAEVHQMLSIPFLPILFFLSGYLFFYSKSFTQRSDSIFSWITTSYVPKLKKRVLSLFIPYVIWSIVSFFYQSLVKHTNYNIHSPWDVIILFWDTGSGHPIGMALWYMRNLMVFALLSPLYFVVVKYLKHFTLILILVLQVFCLPIDYPFFNEYLLLGAYLSLMDVSVERITCYFNWKICLLAYIILKTVMFSFDVPQINGYVVLFLCIVGLMDFLMKHPIPVLFAASSTFVYMSHPYFTGLRNIYVRFIDTNSLFLDFVAWIASAVTVFSLCLCMFYIMKCFMPRVLAVISGGRI